jgi:hypothetical protein
MNIIDIKKGDRVEEIIEMRTILDKESDTELLEDVLKKLEGYGVTYDDLKVTKIGHSLKKLTKHKSEAIVKKAENLMNKWKKLVGGGTGNKDIKDTKEPSRKDTISPQKGKG